MCPRVIRLVFMGEVETELAFEGPEDFSNHRGQEKTFQQEKGILARRNIYLNTRFKSLCTSGGRGGFVEMFSKLVHCKPLVHRY